MQNVEIQKRVHLRELQRPRCQQNVARYSILCYGKQMVSQWTLNYSYSALLDYVHFLPNFPQWNLRNLPQGNRGKGTVLKDVFQGFSNLAAIRVPWGTSWKYQSLGPTPDQLNLMGPRTVLHPKIPWGIPQAARIFVKMSAFVEA